MLKKKNKKIKNNARIHDHLFEWYSLQNKSASSLHMCSTGDMDVFDVFNMLKLSLPIT